VINPLNDELNPICHLLALLGAHHIFHVSGIRVKRVARAVMCWCWGMNRIIKPVIWKGHFVDIPSMSVLFNDAVSR